MVLKLYLFSFLLVLSSCGRDFRKRNPQKEEAFLSHIKTRGFSSRAEKRVFNAYKETKEKEKSLEQIKKKEERKKRVIDLKLSLNEIYEEELYEQMLPDRDLNEVTHKYNFLKSVGIEDPKSVPNPLVLDNVVKVYKDYGRLYVAPSKIKHGKHKAFHVSSKKVPWSGHWYPFSSDKLYHDENSPLGKFDALVKAAKGNTSTARAYQKKTTKGIGSTGWEGLCDAWSLAAIMTEEPRKPVDVFGIHFSIPDLKALLTFSHLGYPYEQYGYAYRGDIKTDSAYQDISPEAFHHVVNEVIGGERRATMVDEMSGLQVWNKPLFAYRWKVVQDEKNENAFLIKAYPRFVKHRRVETDKPTTYEDMETPIYRYKFYVDKTSSNHDKYLVMQGEWTGDSFRDHPDNIKVPHKKGKPSSHNLEFNRNMDVLKFLY